MAENKVVLIGSVNSPYVKRVELALKSKGIAYEYVSEDLKNKSSLLLKSNPVQKKVPVLIHNGKPISESNVILEYIDEVWTNGPKILPEEPYQRAKVRFWAAYLQPVFDFMLTLTRTQGEAQAKVQQELMAKLVVVEEYMTKDLFPGGKHNVGAAGRQPGMIDYIVVSLFSHYKAMEEAFGVKLLDAEKTPFLISYADALNEIPTVKESLLSHEKMVEFLKGLKSSA